MTGVVRVGHKGADALVSGNTLASFERALEVGVEVIEFDVLPVGEKIMIAHDLHDAERPGVLTLDAVLEAFSRPPLDRVVFDCDIKARGAEPALVEGLRRHGLLPRAQVSTSIPAVLTELRRLEPALERGWTLPHVTRDWTRTWWAKPAIPIALELGRRRLPSVVRQGQDELRARNLWVFHPLITRRLVATTRELGLRLIAWTVDDPTRIGELVDLGVDGIVSNDPRLLSHLTGSTKTTPHPAAQGPSPAGRSLHR
ncbi:MAG: glycerophosphodiester phosphodiesterase [Solirubrobacterales bacterium]